MYRSACSRRMAEENSVSCFVALLSDTGRQFRASRWFREFQLEPWIVGGRWVGRIILGHLKQIRWRFRTADVRELVFDNGAAKQSRIVHS